MKILSVQVPSLAFPTDSSSSWAWTGLRCQTPFSFAKTPFPNPPNLQSCPFRQVRMMGGGPRTFPGGVTKRKWKRIQEKKAKQLLRAGLIRERQLYEKRKQAELRAATAELEKPWGKQARAPPLFGASADKQLRAMADRFHKLGGFGLSTAKDGPQSFKTVDGQTYARVFPKNVICNTMPYTRNHNIDSSDASSSRSEATEEQAWEYTDFSVSNSARDTWQRYGSSLLNGKFNANSVSRKGFSVLNQRDYTKRRENGSILLERRILPSNQEYGMDSVTSQGISQKMRDYNGSRQINSGVVIIQQTILDTDTDLLRMTYRAWQISKVSNLNAIEPCLWMN